MNELEYFEKNSNEIYTSLLGYSIQKTSLKELNKNKWNSFCNYYNLNKTSSGFQLHIHEQAGGTAHIWDYGRNNKIGINSYDAAMADLFADKLGVKKILQDLKNLGTGDK